MAAPRWMNALTESVGRFAVASHRRPLAALLVVGALSAAGFWGASTLTLSADLTELLPRSFRSVRDLDLLRQRFGGIGYGVVVAQGAEPEVLRRFAQDLTPKLEQLPGVRFVEATRATAFFTERALYYMELDDLEEMERRIKAREKWERRKRNPLLVELGEPEPAPPLDFSDIEKKYADASNQKLAGTGETYYLDESKKMVVLLAKPAGLSVDLDYAKQFIGSLERLLAEQDLKSYSPTLEVALTGTFKKRIDQQQQITRDVASASSVAMVLMLLYLLIHFRSALGVAFVLVPVSAGLLWTYGVVALGYGTVNILTAFLGAILGGLGTEHGIHLIGRYTALRAEGKGSEDATREAFSHTGGSALVSSLVAALTFGSLAISEFRAFREFGVIAAVGMILVALACIVTVPALIGLASRLGWSPKSREAVVGRGSSLARWLPRFARPLALGGSAVAVLLMLQLPKASFDFNFEALQDSSLPSFRLDHDVNRILGYSQTPVVILTEKPEEERLLVAQMKERKARLGARSTVDFVASLADLVPADQERKQELLGSIGRVLGRVKAENLEPALGARLEDFKKMAAAAPFTRDDVPASVRRQFEGVNKAEGGFVLIFPSVGTSDGENVKAIAREVRGLSLPDGREVGASGEAMILADILEMVESESVPVLIAALVLVLLAMWITLGSLKETLICLSPTVVSVLALIGLLPLADIRLNFLNIVAIPVLIGTTVDAGIHLLSRLREVGEESFETVFSETGRAICGGLLTSAVGFGAMLLADHPGLRSLGVLTVLGFSMNLLVMLVVFPSFLHLASLRKAAKAAPVPAP